jgi:hypothetical protein
MAESMPADSFMNAVCFRNRPDIALHQIDASRLPSRLDNDIAKTSAIDFSQSMAQTETEQSMQLGMHL